MSFLGKLAKGIQETIEIEKLEKINERRVKQYEELIENIINGAKNKGSILNNDEAARFEQESIDICLKSYDEEACPYMGRAVNENWAEEGGNNLEIRKRMLNRELQKKRGHIVTVFGPMQQQIIADHELYIGAIRNYQQQVASALPLSPDELKDSFSDFHAKLDTIIRTKYSDGIEFFDRFVKGRLTTQLAAARVEITAQNNQIIAKRQDVFEEKVFQDLYVRLQQSIIDRANKLKENLDQSGPDYIMTNEFVDRLHNHIDQYVVRLTNEIQKREAEP